jgi:hypothetical protein
VKFKLLLSIFIVSLSSILLPVVRDTKTDRDVKQLAMENLHSSFKKTETLYLRSIHKVGVNSNLCDLVSKAKALTELRLIDLSGNSIGKMNEKEILNLLDELGKIKRLETILLMSNNFNEMDIFGFLGFVLWIEINSIASKLMFSSSELPEKFKDLLTDLEFKETKNISANLSCWMKPKSCQN